MSESPEEISGPRRVIGTPSPAPKSVDVAEKPDTPAFSAEPSMVDHAKNAVSVGMALRPTELLIFGNPKGGTPLMQENQVSGIDLPVRALVWQDADGRVWLTYNDPRWLAARHGLGAPSQPALDAMTAGLAAIARDATQSDAG